MTVELRYFRDLDSVGADAAGALDAAAQPCLFDRLDWFRTVHRHEPEGEPLVLRAANGASRCWLFLRVNGNRAEALANWYTLRFGPVIAPPGAEHPPIDWLSRGLRKAGISELHLKLLAEEDRLDETLRRRGWVVRRDKVNVNWRIDTSAMTFDQYWAGRPSRLRNTTARRARKARLDLVVHTRFDETAWADYESVYQASWKPPEGSPEALRQFAEEQAAAGSLRLGLAYREQQPVAAQLWTIENGEATIHKLAYREDASDLSPGSIISMEMFRRAIDVDKARVIDFGVGDDPYKSEWMTDKVPLYALTAYDPLSLSGGKALARLALQKVTRGLRRGASPARSA